MWALLGSHDSEKQKMQTVTTIGLDIAKSVSMALMLMAKWSSAVS
jgi:hypothetical protein